MKSTTRQQWIGCCIFVFISAASLVITKQSSSLSTIYKSVVQPASDSELFTISSHCSNIGSQKDTCKFVKSHCHGFNVAYLELYYCSTFWKPVSVAILLSCLLVLFGAISVVASDFFCPNLQTISNKLQLSESMAGVTVLALGNGSPDLFSTFSAMDTGAGSLAIGELIGAAFFIVAIVSGCMGIIKPFQSQRVTFMRDALLLTGAIIMMTWIVYFQQIHWYHSIALICYYLFYVSVVVLGAYRNKEKDMEKSEPCISEVTHLLGENRSPRITIKDRGFSSVASNMSEYGQNHFGHIIRPMSLTSRTSQYFDAIPPRSTSTNGSIASKTTYRRTMTPRIGMRTSVFGAIEFQEQVHSIQRAHSLILSPKRRNRRISMPPPMWQNLQSGHSRQRASSMTDQTAPMIITSSNVNTTQDYFTYLSAHNNHFIHIQPSSPPPQPEITIPEIRLAPPLNDETRLASPDYMDVQHHLWFNSARRSRDNSNASLAPPASILSAESDTFFSARSESFDLSPSNSFDHQGQLLSAILNISHEENHCTTEDTTSFAMLSPQLHVPEDAPHLLNPPLGPRYHHRDHSERSFYSNYSYYPSSSDALEELYRCLFPTLQRWEEKTFFSKLSSLVATPLVLVFTLTLPVAELEHIKIDDVEVLDEAESISKNYLSVPATAASDLDLSSKVVVVDDVDTKQGWNKHLLILQCIVSSTFIFGVLAGLIIVNQVIPYALVALGITSGIVVSIYVGKSTRIDEPPTWFWALSFVGFFVALNWIFLLANEVVGLLQALGEIFYISDAIMGLTVFALGNSIGDFVANTAIAKMGFPTMAISACYAGPLLNMVLGVGVSSFYQTWKFGQAYQLDIAPTIIVSSCGLTIVLLSTLFVVNMNGYYVTKRLGIWMICVYLTCCTINFLLEFQIIGSS